MCYTVGMIIVIIAGGSGTRLWPLSTNQHPKQLLALTGDRSMVQSTYDRARLITQDIYVAPDSSHAAELRQQLPDLTDDQLVVEPGRRGTANCIVAALAQVAKRHDHDEPIAFIHADHHIRDTEGFVRSFQVAAEVSRQQGRLTLIGIEPTYPATGFGYIQRGGPANHHPGVSTVKSFQEKPDYDTAKTYLASGRYLWNCGYFVGSVNTFVDQMERYAPDLADHYQRLLAIDDPTSPAYHDTYLSFDTQVIDIALIEKSPDLLVVPASFDWMDVGNFKDLHDASDRDAAGNHLRGANLHTLDIENAYIRNEEPDKPVAVIGLDNIVVVNTTDGLLIARKDVSMKVGEIAKQIQAGSAQESS